MTEQPDYSFSFRQYQFPLFQSLHLGSRLEQYLLDDGDDDNDNHNDGETNSVEDKPNCV